MTATDLTQQKAAKIAGSMFLFFIVISIVHYSVVELKLITKNIDETVAFIRNRELLFRAGIVVDLILFISGIVLFTALYTILRPVNRMFALLSLFLILIETAVAVMIEFSSFVSLLLINSEGFSTAFETKQTQAVLQMVLDLRALGYGIVIIFFSLGYAFFFYLFSKSDYIPSILSLTGILTSMLMLALTCVQIIIISKTIEIIAQTSSLLLMVHQIAVGLWLLIKGIKITDNKSLA